MHNEFDIVRYIEENIIKQNSPTESSSLSSESANKTIVFADTSFESYNYAQKMLTNKIFDALMQRGFTILVASDSAYKKVKTIDEITYPITKILNDRQLHDGWYVLNNKRMNSIFEEAVIDSVKQQKTSNEDDLISTISSLTMDPELAEMTEEEEFDVNDESTFASLETLDPNNNARITKIQFTEQASSLDKQIASDSPLPKKNRSPSTHPVSNNDRVDIDDESSVRRPEVDDEVFEALFQNDESSASNKKQKPQHPLSDTLIVDDASTIPPVRPLNVFPDQKTPVSSLVEVHSVTQKDPFKQLQAKSASAVSAGHYPETTIYALISKPQNQTIERKINRHVEKISDQKKLKEFHSPKGLTVFAPTSKEPYSLRENGSITRAVLPNPVGEIDYNKTALTLMNMIENVVSRGNEVKIITKDPILANFADAYIKYLENQGLKCQYEPSEVLKQASTKDVQKAKDLFKEIIREINQSPNQPPQPPWFKAALEHQPKPGAELTTGLTIRAGL